MPFDLGGDATRPHPSAGGMGEVRKGMANLVRRTPDRAREQVANSTRLVGSRIAYGHASAFMVFAH
jgi:hypothetical protein